MSAALHRGCQGCPGCKHLLEDSEGADVLGWGHIRDTQALRGTSRGLLRPSRLEVTRCWGASRGPPPLSERLLGTYCGAASVLEASPYCRYPAHPPPPLPPVPLAVTLPVAPSPEHPCHPLTPSPGNVKFFTKYLPLYPHLSTGSFRGGGGGTFIQPCSLSHKCCGGLVAPEKRCLDLEDTATCWPELKVAVRTKSVAWPGMGPGSDKRWPGLWEISAPKRLASLVRLRNPPWAGSAGLRIALKFCL